MFYWKLCLKEYILSPDQGTVMTLVWPTCQSGQHTLDCLGRLDSKKMTLATRGSTDSPANRTVPQASVMSSRREAARATNPVHAPSSAV